MGGGGMIMYMDGFRWALSPNNNNNPCLNLYFPSWTLNTRTKYVAAMVGVFGLAVLVEGVSKLRHVIVVQARKQRRQYRLRRRRQQQRQQQRRGNETNYGDRNESFFLLRQANEFLSEHLLTLVRWTIVLLHGLQALVGYILMLAIMTYSVELFLMVILGLTTGYATFFGKDVGGGDEHDEDTAVAAVHVTTNPCCNFMQDEASEVRPRQQRQQQHVAAGTPYHQDEDDATAAASAAGNPSSSSHGLHPLNAAEVDDDEDQGTEPLLRSHR